MAAEGKTQEVAANPSNADLAKIIADGISAGMAAAAGPKKVKFGQYNPNSPWHPDKKTAAVLKRACFQNGSRIDPTVVSDADILLLNQIKVSGNYFDGYVDVVVRKQGTEETVDIIYTNNTVDKRLEQKSYFRDFSELVQHIVKHQAKAA